MLEDVDVFWADGLGAEAIPQMGYSGAEIMLPQTRCMLYLHFHLMTSVSFSKCWRKHLLVRAYRAVAALVDVMNTMHNFVGLQQVCSRDGARPILPGACPVSFELCPVSFGTEIDILNISWNSETEILLGWSILYFGWLKADELNISLDFI